MTDDQLLDMLSMRDTGMSCNKIARHMGVTKNTIIGALDRIKRDLAKSEGEE